MQIRLQTDKTHTLALNRLTDYYIITAVAFILGSMSKPLNVGKYATPELCDIQHEEEGAGVGERELKETEMKSRLNDQ